MEVDPSGINGDGAGKIKKMYDNPGDEGRALLGSEAELKDLPQQIQAFLRENWDRLDPEEKKEIAYALGFSEAECASHIKSGSWKILMKNSGCLSRFRRPVGQLLKFIVSLTAAGGGFKTGLATKGILNQIGVPVTDAETTIMNGGGGFALAIFFAIGDYSQTSSFLRTEWKKSKARVGGYLLLLLLNATLSAFFAYTGTKGTMAVFGVVLDSIFEEEAIGGVLFGSNLLANLALTGGAAKKHQQRSMSRSAIGGLFFIYLASMLMYIVSPLEANLFRLEEQSPYVKGGACLATSIAIFYSAIVMLGAVENPRAAYKHELKEIFDYIRGCNGPMSRAATGTYFLIMVALIFMAMMLLFTSNNISAFMWLVQDVDTSIQQADGIGMTNSSHPDAINFKQMGPQTISFIIYSVICLLVSALMLGVIAMEGVRELLRGFEPYGITQAMITRIERKLALKPNDESNA